MTDRCERCDRDECRREAAQDAYYADPHHDAPLKLSRPEPPTHAAWLAAHADCDANHKDWRREALVLRALYAESQRALSDRDELLRSICRTVGATSGCGSQDGDGMQAREYRDAVRRVEAMVERLAAIDAVVDELLAETSGERT